MTEFSQSPNQSDWFKLILLMAAECHQFSRIGHYKCQAFSQDSKSANCRPSCTYHCESIQDLVEHFRTTHVNLLRYCPPCAEMFVNTYSWLKHLKKTHRYTRDDYLNANACVVFLAQCECCLETLDGQGKVSVDQVHKHVTSSPSKHFSTKLVYKCSSCSKTFNTHRHLKLHSEICDIVYAEIEEKTKIHKKSSGNHGFSSRIQQLLKINGSSVSENGQNEENLKPERGQRNEDSVKNSEFLVGAWRNLTRQIHESKYLMQAADKELPISHSQLSSSAPSHQKCRHCHKSISSRAFARHKKNCSYKKAKYHCRKCSKACSTKEALLDHGYQHLREKHKICLFCCNRLLREDETLYDHMRQQHTNKVVEFPLECPLCEVSLKNKNMLEVHFECHHSLGIYEQTNTEQPGVSNQMLSFAENLICAWCDQTFANLGKLSLHIKFTHRHGAV